MDINSCSFSGIWPFSNDQWLDSLGLFVACIKLNHINYALVLTYNNFVVLIIMSWLVSTVCGSIRLRPGPSRCVRYYWASARCWSASSLAPCSWSPESGSESRVSLNFNDLIQSRLQSSMFGKCYLPIIAFNFLISEFCSSTLLCSFSVDSPTSLLHSSSTIDYK